MGGPPGSSPVPKAKGPMRSIYQYRGRKEGER